MSILAIVGYVGQWVRDAKRAYAHGLRPGWAPARG